MYLSPGLYYWTPIFPGTDGGFILGKNQKSGGQEVNALSSAGGEITAVWNYGANWGTFFTDPGASTNIFDNASCSGAACIGKTELKVWNTAWNKYVILMGSALGCNPAVTNQCTADQIAGIFVKTWTINPVTGGSWSMTYNQVVPIGSFQNFPYELILRGTVTTAPPTLASLSADKTIVATGVLVTLTGTCTTTSPTTVSTCLISQSTGPATTNTQAPTGTYSQTRIDTFTPTQDGTYVFALTTTPDSGTSDTDSVTVTVQTPAAPLQPSTSEGCSMVQGAMVNPSERFDWWLVLGFIAWLGMITWRRQQARV
jgi:hypothetical protein